jgi:glycosyltransferase involved in cell wall biosynthesis
MFHRTTEPDSPLDRMNKLKVLFLVEGFTDIRFVIGLSEICSLTLAVPAGPFARSGLKDRLAETSANMGIVEFNGGRLAFQIRSLLYLLRSARHFDVILSQEVLRGSLNANLGGALFNVPVVTYMGISPVEYFRCRWERRQIGWLKKTSGEMLIRALMSVNGQLAARCLAMGPYLQSIAANYSPRSEIGLYYGVDTAFFRPLDPSDRQALRVRLKLPCEKFLIVCPSRISHEKDPETVLRATAIARQEGLDAAVLNLGGEFQRFLDLSRTMALPQSTEWILGRPAAHPMNDLAKYYQAADAVALASLAEGAAFSTLEALACGTPVVATSVGGMAVQLNGYARLTPRRDPRAMAEEFLWIASHRKEAVDQALMGRGYVAREWSRERAFGGLQQVLETVVKE